MRLRLLPVLVLTAVLALTVRIGDLWRGVDGVARAQTVEKPATPGNDPAQPGTQAEAQADSQAGSDAGTDQPSGLPSDPLLMTDEEIDLLRALADRRRTLDERARELSEREALLQAAQRRIEEKVGDLEALKKGIEAQLAQKEDENETQYQSLVKIYESMKPKDAARIFEELDMAVLLPVVERMKERKTAPILAKMDPVKAQAITVELAQRRNSPPAEP